MKAKRRISNLLANLGLLIVSLLFVDLALHAASVFLADIDRVTRPPCGHDDKSVSPVVDDDRLGMRGNPEWRDHDARGFRNLSALGNSAIVALGDSHTYGSSVKTDEPWPSRLSVLLGEDVYNMGLGGYGPAHNAENLSTAMALEPKLVIFGLYLGNDFYDDFEFAKRNGLISEYADADVLRHVSELEKRQTLGDEIGFLFRSGRETERPTPAQTPSKHSERSNALRTAGEWLSCHSRLYGLARRTKKRVGSYFEDTNALLARDFDRAREKLSDWQLAYVSAYDGPTWKTIFTSPYRLRTLDDADPRIRIGIEISKQMIGQMYRRVTEAGAKFVVLFLPTKEYVFWPRVESPDEHKSLANLIGHEDRIRSEIKVYLQERGIDFIDPVPALRETEHQPYFPDGDGHPNALGHEIIAEKVFEYIKANPNLRIVSH